MRLRWPNLDGRYFVLWLLAAQLTLMFVLALILELAGVHDWVDWRGWNWIGALMATINGFVLGWQARGTREQYERVLESIEQRRKEKAGE